MTLHRLLPGAAACALVMLATSAPAQEPGPDASAAAGSSAAGPVPLGSPGLEQWRITSLTGIAAASPALTLVASLGSNNTPLLYIRGQGLAQPEQITRDGAVGIFQDGFYVARAQALIFDQLDLDHAEVLPGPQGALYGRNTSGGVVNLTSAAPSGEFHYLQSAEFGNRNLFRVLASVDAPEWHGISVKATLLASSIDGYVKNPQPGAQDFGEEQQKAGRLQLRWDLLPGLRADYALERSDVDSTPDYDTNPSLNGDTIYSSQYPYFANPNGPTDTAYRPVLLPQSTSDHVAHRLTLSWDPDSALWLKSLTGYRTLEAQTLQDYVEFLGLAERTADTYEDYQFSEELRLGGDLFDKQLSYTLGGEYFKEHGLHGRGFGFLSVDREIERSIFADTKSSAAYLQLHWQPELLRRRLELQAAARYTKDIKDAERSETDTDQVYVESGAANDLSYRRVNPSATLTFHLADNIATYATAETGYQAGGALETAPVHAFGTSTFRPEDVLTYELGLRSGFLDERLKATLAAFSTRERNVQYALPFDPVTDQVYTLAQATVRGADLSLAARPLPDLTLSAAATYLHQTIDRAAVLPGTLLDPASGSGSPYSVGESIVDLFVLPYTPKYNATAGIDYILGRWYEGELTAHLDYEYRGQYYSDFAAGPAVPGRAFDVTPSAGLLNAQLLFASQIDYRHRLKFGFWGRNVLNRKYYALAGGFGGGVSVFTANASGAQAPEGWIARAGAWAEPATYGITATYEY